MILFIVYCILVCVIFWMVGWIGGCVGVMVEFVLLLYFIFIVGLLLCYIYDGGVGVFMVWL